MNGDMVSMRLDVELRERLEFHATKRGWTRSELIRRVLSAWCEQQEGVR